MAKPLALVAFGTGRATRPRNRYAQEILNLAIIEKFVAKEDAVVQGVCLSTYRIRTLLAGAWSLNHFSNILPGN
jgi:hypothetical protein